MDYILDFDVYSKTLPSDFSDGNYTIIKDPNFKIEFSILDHKFINEYKYYSFDKPIYSANYSDIITSISYHDGIKIREMTYSPDGILKSDIRYKENSEILSSLIYDDSGRLEEFTEYHLDYPIIINYQKYIYDNNGIPMLDGIVIKNHDLNRDLISEGSYSDDIPDGEFIYRTIDNKVIKILHYSKGLLEGTAQVLYNNSNNNIKIDETYSRGKLHGLQTKYDIYSNVEESTNYSYDFPSGTKKIFDNTILTFKGDYIVANNNTMFFSTGDHYYYYPGGQMKSKITYDSQGHNINEINFKITGEIDETKNKEIES